MAAELLKGKPLADAIKAELSKEIERLKVASITPSLASVQVGANEASAVYIGSQRKQCEAMGISYQLHELPDTTSQADLHSFLERLNSDSAVNGIILQLPLPPSLDARAAQGIISLRKDVDCLSPASLGMVLMGQARLAPCTPSSVLELIKSTGVDLRGKEITLVGYGAVGRPLAMLLLRDYPTLTLCDIGTSERGHLEEHVRRAEVLITVIGAKPGLIKGAWVREGAMVIDVSIIRVGEGIKGDVEFEPAAERAAFITPVPGGVGPLTVAMLLRNTVEATKWQREA